MHRNRLFAIATAWLLFLSLSGCSGPTAPPLLEPSEGLLTGYYDVRADITSLGLSAADISGVRVGGIMALSPRGDADGWLRFTVQGAPEPGAATVAFETAEGSVSLETDFTYAPPLSPYFERVVAFGASLTMGVMDGTPTYEGVMKSPSLQTARALGAYMPQPLLVPDLFPTVGLDLVGPGPECETANVEEFLTLAIPQILGELAYPDGSGFGYEMGRSDPLLEVRNIGVGGYQLDDVVLGPESNELVQNVLGSFVYAPFADFGVAPERTMMEVVEDLAPSLLLSFDLLGNDILLGRPATRIAQYLPEVIDRLAATGAEVFIADAPNPDILEGNLGEDIPDEDGEELAEEYNAILGAEAARYDNIHVVPIKEASDGLIADGLVVADRSYNVQMLGGLLSFDGLHFSDTGYALVAQTFVDAINEALGTEVPPVDIAAVAAEDFHTPEAVLAAGRDPSECWD